MIAIDPLGPAGDRSRGTRGRGLHQCDGNETRVLMSAGTLTEALIVSGRRKRAREMARLIEGLGIEIVPVTPAVARLVAEAYGRWGKGVNPAALNFGDCFSYEVAKQHSCPLLFIGGDFSMTDLESVL